MFWIILPWVIAAFSTAYALAQMRTIRAEVGTNTKLWALIKRAESRAPDEDEADWWKEGGASCRD